MTKDKSQGSEPDAGPDPEQEARPRRLADVTLKEIGKLPTAEMVRLCKLEGLPGTKADKRERLAFLLTAMKRGGHLGYVHGHTLCPACRLPMTLYKTVPQGMDDGRVLDTRYMRCPNPKRRHRWQFKEVQAKAAADSGPAGA